MSGSIRTVRLVITGRVQGVGYRAWLTRLAAGLSVTGWVRNRRNGSVEALVAGPEPAVAEIIEACRRGPAGASVMDVEIAAAEPDGCRGFAARPTL